MIKSLNIVFFAAALLLLAGCYEDKDVFIPDGSFEYAGSIQNLKSEFKSPYHALPTFDLEEPQAIKIEEGVSILVQPGNFVNAQGESVNEDLKMFFLLTTLPSEWIASELSFMGEKSILDVNFANKIVLRNDAGEEIFINPQSPPQLRIEVEHLQQFEADLFTFDKEDKDGKWIQSPGFEFDVVSWEEEGQAGELLLKEGIQYAVEYTGWHALAKEADLTPEVVLCAELPEGYSQRNTAVYAIMSNYNSVVKLGSWSKNGEVCNPAFLLPLDQAADVVSISAFTGGRYFFAMNQVILDQQDFNTYLSPTRKSLNAIRESINNRN